VQKTVTALKIDGVVTTPLLHPGQDLVDDYICYKLTCKKDSGDVPPETVGGQDQFGARSFSRFKAVELCAPA